MVKSDFQSLELKTLAKVIERLNLAGIAHMLTGSMALNFYAHPRATNDFDIVIEARQSDAPKIVNLFQKDFYISEEAVLTALDQTGMFNIIDNESVFKVDFIVRKSDDFSGEQFRRRQKKQLGSFKLDVISPEDLVLAKLVWAQQTGSALQEKDVRNILRVLKQSLDFPYMEQWAGVLGILDKLRAFYG